MLCALSFSLYPAVWYKGKEQFSLGKEEYIAGFAKYLHEAGKDLLESMAVNGKVESNAY